MVVIILAILAAIAVPQYQNAVLKSHVMSGMAIGKAMMDAMDLYYLEHGKFVGDTTKFTINLPAGAQNADGTPMTSLPTALANKIYYGVDTKIPKQYEFTSGGLLHYKVLASDPVDIYFCSRYATISGCSEELVGKIYCTYNTNVQKARCERMGATKKASGNQRKMIF